MNGGMAQQLLTKARRGLDRRLDLDCPAEDLVKFTRADINARDNGGWTPLMFAIREGSIECVMLLLELGASATWRTYDAIREYRGPDSHQPQIRAAINAAVSLKCVRPRPRKGLRRSRALEFLF